jgi:hypothetical protein
MTDESEGVKPRLVINSQLIISSQLFYLYSSVGIILHACCYAMVYGAMMVDCAVAGEGNIQSYKTT